MLKKPEYIDKKINRKNNLKNYLELFLSEKIRFEVPVKTSRELTWENISTKIRKSENRTKNKTQKLNHTLMYSLSVAASILFLIGAFYFVSLNTQILVETNAGEIIEHILPDQSSVILNADSKLSYKKGFWNISRKVKLMGEAIFKVKKGSWFNVNTKKGNVKVLGTVFNVFARDNIFKVACFTGKVKVRLDRCTNHVILKQGQETHLNNQNILSKAEKFNVSQVGKWQQGEFNYSKEKIENVFKELERQYNVKIINKNIGTRYYTGSFNNRNINKALELICLPMNLQYSIKDSSIIIIRKRK